jgi:peptide chain release factor 3
MVFCIMGLDFTEIFLISSQVLQYRMLSEYGVEIQLEPLGYSVARWVMAGWPAIEKCGKLYNCATVKDWVRNTLKPIFPL